MPKVQIDVKTDLHGSPKKLDTMDKSLGQMDESAKKAGDSLVEVGRKAGRAMTIAGAAIVTGLGLMVKAASDAQETTAKFGTVFEDVFEEASKAAQNLADNYGLSVVASKEMLGATGDLLTGLGLSGEAALSLSEQTQQLSVDLASFTNFSGGAKGASEALTKAMLGERESVKALGIVITEEMVKEELLRLGKEKLTGQAKLQAKAEATLTIALRQSRNAIGDYQRTQDSLANVVRTLQARFSDLVVEIGDALIPIVTSLAKTAKDVVEKITEWVKAHPGLTKVIVLGTAALGALMLVLGPLLMILPGIIAAVGLMSAGFIAVLAPIALVVASLSALAIGYLAVKDAQKKAQESSDNYEKNVVKLRDKLNETRKAVGMNTREWNKLVAAYDSNFAAMAMAIVQGKEGKEMQEALAEVSKKSKKAFDEQKGATEALTGKTKDLSDTFTIKLNPALVDTEGKIKNLIKPTEDLWKQFDNLELGVESAAEAYLFMDDTATASMDSILESVGITTMGQQKAFDETAAAAEEAARLAQEAWEESHMHILNLIDNIGGVIGQLVMNFEASWEGVKDFFGGLFDGILNSFKNMIGNMVTEWTVNFLKNTLLNLTQSAITETAGVITGGIGSAIKSVTTTAAKLATSFTPAGMIGSALTGAISGLISGLVSGGKATDQIRLLRDIKWWAEKTYGILERNILSELYKIKDDRLGLLIPMLQKFDTMLSEFYKIRDNTGGILKALTSQGTVFVDVFRSGVFESMGINIVDAVSTVRDSIDGGLSDVAGRISEIDFDTGGIVDAVDRMRDKFGREELNGGIPELQRGGSFDIKREGLFAAKVHPGEKVTVSPAGQAGVNNINITINVPNQLDPHSAQRIVEKQIAPQLVRIFKSNTGSFRTNWKLAEGN